MLEFDESKGTYKGVPKMWEVWIQDEPSGGHWEWENIRVSLVSTRKIYFYLYCAVMQYRTVAVYVFANCSLIRSEFSPCQ